MGKTALLRHFLHHLENKKKAEGIFVDLLGTSGLADANRLIAAAIIRKYGNPKKGLGSGLVKLISSLGATVSFDSMSGVPQITFGLSQANSPIYSLEVMGSYLAEKKNTIIICIDEFQQIVNYHEENAETVFRNWMQNFPMVRFVFSGSHREMMVSMFSRSSRPFYRSAQIHLLGPLPSNKYEVFISNHFKRKGKKINQKAIARIFHWTRMQTYYVQLVCNKLYGKTDVVNETYLEEVFDEIIQQEIPVFSSYQQLLTAFQWKVLVSIGKKEEVKNPLSQDFISQFQLGATSSVKTALESLIHKEFVIIQDGKYTLHDTLLMRWLQQL